MEFFLCIRKEVKLYTDCYNGKTFLSFVYDISATEFLPTFISIFFGTVKNFEVRMKLTFP